MDTIIPPSCYFEPRVFQAEQRSVFGLHWQFVGVLHDLQNHNDYVTAEIGGTPLVVQNFEGSLRAFVNVCSHRFNRIQLEPCGNRPLRCTYHGWTYDGRGVPVGIPQRPRFDGLTTDRLEALRLTSWTVETCGSLVFVRCESEQPNLRHFLGDAFDLVEQISLAFGPMIERHSFEAEANWKVMVENTLESYHVDFVHPATFSKLGLGEGGFSWQRPHSSWRAPLSAAQVAKNRRIDELLAKRPWKTDGYLHQLVFPNLTIATTLGLTFSLQLFEPLGPSRTRFTTMVFQTRLDDSGKAAAVAQDVVGPAAAAFNRVVFEEDRVVCERVQLGIRHASGAGVLSDEELRVAEFQAAYLVAMKGN